MARRPMAAAAAAQGKSHGRPQFPGFHGTGPRVGRVFEYNFPYAVTVRKGESAMLPFLQQKISARKLLIYCRSRCAQHPHERRRDSPTTRARRWTAGRSRSSTAGAYGGEALMETLKASDKRLISYAVDLGTRITTQFDSSSESFARSTSSAACSRPPGAPGNPDLHHPQRRPETEDADR